MNLLKAGITLASKITTVSPRYAKEIQTVEYGAGLDGVLRGRKTDLVGILNGIDYALWDPGSDEYLSANFTVDALDGKASCKAALQEYFGLPKRDVPLFGLVSRLFWQKGIDLILDALPMLARRDLQIVVQGTGDPELESRLVAATEQYPEMVGLALKFDTGLAHRIQAGSDFFLMPSRYEPCGLTQLHSMAYGTIPIVRHTGGLADSVRNLNVVHEANGTATGISFIPLTPQAIVRAVDRAVALREDSALYRKVQRRGMEEQFCWDRASESYLATYAGASASP
jgi:starch synthase